MYLIRRNSKSARVLIKCAIVSMVRQPALNFGSTSISCPIELLKDGALKFHWKYDIISFERTPTNCTFYMSLFDNKHQKSCLYFVFSNRSKPHLTTALAEYHFFHIFWWPKILSLLNQCLAHLLIKFGIPSFSKTDLFGGSCVEFGLMAEFLISNIKVDPESCCGIFCSAHIFWTFFY